MRKILTPLLDKSGTIFFALLLTACIPEVAEQPQAAPKARQQRLATPASLPEPSVLENCLFAEPCLIGELPPLGLEHEQLEDTAVIMARVWSSEPWMKERFGELLDRLPREYLRLFRPVTAIAIAEDIRPSHYWPATGGIYLDPSFLWQTQEEKETIAISTDPRSEHLAELPIRVRWRYVGENNTNPFRFHSLQLTANRTLSQTFLPFAAMLTHELAHANDYLPPHAYELLNDASSFQDAVFYGIDTHLHKMKISTVLYDRFPLNSPQLVPAARNYYANDPKLSNRTAAELANHFAPDVVSSFYSYTRKQEDLAMLFEEVMMKEFFNLDRDMAFTETAQQGNASCNDYLVHWGIRNRFADTLVRERAQFAVTQLFPEYDFSFLFAEVYESTPLTADVGWCDSIVIREPVAEQPSQDYDYDLSHYQDITKGHLHYIPVEEPY